MKTKTLKKVTVTIALLVTFFLSMCIISVHLVFAAYTVPNPTYPFQVEDADIAAPWGVVGLSDQVTLALAYGSQPGSPNWNPVADLNHDGIVNLADLSILSHFYGQSVVYPVANVTSLEFDANSSANPTQDVYYYMIARVYIQANPSNDAYFLVANAVRGKVQSIKFDDTQFSGGAPSINQSLGSLVRFHVLQFVFDNFAGSGGGSVTFSITTSAGVYASLYKFRVYVPNYSSNLYGYRISAKANFYNDWYWLCGNSNGYINNVCLGYATLWNSWEWSTASPVSLNGLNCKYPLSPYGPIKDAYTVNFTYWSSGAGLLDFQFVSQSQQTQILGPPDFCATANMYNLSPCTTLYGENLEGGSSWVGTPGMSQRNITSIVTYNIGYNDSSLGMQTWFNASINVALGAWNATPIPLYNGIPPDFAVPLNISVTNFLGNFWNSGGQYWFWFPQRYTLDFYSFQHMPIYPTLENGQYQSHNVISSSYSMMVTFGGTALLTLAGFATGGLAWIGAGLGLAMTGAGMAIDYTNNQPVSQSNYNMNLKQDYHIELTANSNTPTLVINGNNTQSSFTDLIYLGLRPNSAAYNGMTEVNMQGLLEFGNAYSGYDWYWPIGNLNMTLCVPWFVA